MKKFEDLVCVLLVKFENAFESSFCFMGNFANSSHVIRRRSCPNVHSFLAEDPLDCGVVKRDPNVAGVGGSCILSHWPKPKL